MKVISIDQPLVPTGSTQCTHFLETSHHSVARQDGILANQKTKGQHACACLQAAYEVHLVQRPS
jgi:hypothetical protein